ncbi:MAG: DUF4352 domain-containing protein [Trebonia sp.]
MSGMAYGQDFGGRDSGRLPKPAVPPEFQDRVRHGNPQGAGQPMGTPYRRQPWGGYEQQPYDQPPYGQAPYAGPWAAPRRQRHVVRNVLAGASGAIVVIVGIAVAATANGSGHGMRSTGTSTRSAKPASAAKRATIGTTITLAGYDSGERMGVTVTKVIGNASPTDEFNAPPGGDRLYAVQFRLSDNGSAAYSDAPDISATVIDSSGQSYQAGLETVANCQGFGGTENIAPGSSGLGCVTFKVPTAAKIVAVQFTLDSGMGPDTGQWDVTG